MDIILVDDTIRRYATPFGLTSEYAHPAEILFLGFATIIGPAITGPHLFTLWLWMVLRVLETVEAHCGYHFPWSLSNLLPLYGGWVALKFSVYSWLWRIWNFFFWCRISFFVFCAGLIFMTIITGYFIRSLVIIHQHLSTWTGKFLTYKFCNSMIDFHLNVAITLWLKVLISV